MTINDLRAVSTQIAIIGLGPRGLSVLERIVAHLRSAPLAQPVVVHVIDPKEHGLGTHHVRQPDHLLINTVASQITMYTDPTVVMDGPLVEGPDLASWARAHGYRRIGSRFLPLGMVEEGEPIDDNDYVPRCLLGKYLAWVCDVLVREAPSGLSIRFYRRQAVDLAPRDDGSTRVILDGAFTLDCDWVFLTIGHSANRPTREERELAAFVQRNKARNATLAFFRSCYPLDALEAIAPRTRVAVQGFGLSAHDVIAELTVGRNGEFAEENGRLVYRASRREPQLLLFSRQSLPFSARGINQKGPSGQYRAAFLTDAFVAGLQSGCRQIDFMGEVWPTLHKEMAFAYRIAATGAVVDPATFTPTEQESAAIERLFHPLPPQSFADLRAFRALVREFLDEDLRAAAEGNVSGPAKAASDVLRDVRDTLRLCVDWLGLMPESHRAFMETLVPIMNRIAVGPPLQRNRQLAALIEAGVVFVGGAPGARLRPNDAEARFEIVSSFAGRPDVAVEPADVLVKARIDHFWPEESESPLMQALLARGLVRPYRNGDYHPGGIDVDRNYHPVDASGVARNRIFALGILAEGPNFYTYVLPRPGVNSRFLRDSDRCVAQMLSAVRASETATII
jgi:uncharacterized NAD(P)/FAD-binding protein YdhS